MSMKSFSTIGENLCEIISEASHHNHLPTHMISAKKLRSKCCFLSYNNLFIVKHFPRKTCREIDQTNNIILYINRHSEIEYIVL